MATPRLQNNRTTRILWTDNEAESAIILQLIVNNKHERLAHLNIRFGRERTLTAFKAHISESKGSGNTHSHLEKLWRLNFAVRPGSALVALSQLLGRNLIAEGGSLWYKEELITIASLCSGPSSFETIQNMLLLEYGIPRDVEAQVGRMQGVSSPSNSIWVQYYNDGSGRPATTPSDAWSDLSAGERSRKDLRLAASVMQIHI
ncbi:MAG: hypothetical protein Q9188_004600 [Gyalolechia gomerana]